MAVLPTGFTAGGAVQLHCTACNADTTVALNALSGTSDFVRLPCSNCGAESATPVNGGGHPEAVAWVQLLALRREVAAGGTFAQAKARCDAAIARWDAAARPNLLADVDTAAKLQAIRAKADLPPRSSPPPVVPPQTPPRSSPPPIVPPLSAEAPVKRGKRR